MFYFPAQVKGLIRNLPTLKLPMIGFSMFQISSVKVFWFGVTYQVIAGNSNFMLSMTYDSFVAGLMLQLCSQIDILKQSIKNVPTFDDNLQYQIIKNCVNHQNGISK